MELNNISLKTSTIIVFAVLFYFPLQSQSIAVLGEATKTKDSTRFNELDISLEYRPRAELRRGYRSLPSNDADPAFHISHRGRINVDYQFKNFLFHTSFQDVRIWGDTDPRDAEGKAQFYELYVEPKITEHLSARVGRQRIKYDDERLFAENNWRQAGGQHDAVRILYRNRKLDADLIGAFNQNKANEFGIQYDVPWDNYVVLVANFLNYQLSNNITLTGINYADGFADPESENRVVHFKYTNGGRIEYENNNWYLTFAGYFQHGKIETGEELKAFYLQPEISLKVSTNYTVRLGAQLFSGDNDSNDNISHSFLAQYGAFHRYNGRLDYTQRTVRTYNHEGIINPYLIQDFKLNPKLKLSWESHLLGTQKSIRDDSSSELENLDKFYGWENDFRFIYAINNYTKMELAYLFMIPGKTLEYLPAGKNGNIDNIPQFAYLEVTWTPKLLNLKY